MHQNLPAPPTTGPSLPLAMSSNMIVASNVSSGWPMLIKPCCKLKAWPVLRPLFCDRSLRFSCKTQSLELITSKSSLCILEVLPMFRSWKAFRLCWSNMELRTNDVSSALSIWSKPLVPRALYRLLQHQIHGKISRPKLLSTSLRSKSCSLLSCRKSWMHALQLASLLARKQPRPSPIANQARSLRSHQIKSSCPMGFSSKLMVSLSRSCPFTRSAATMLVLQLSALTKHCLFSHCRLQFLRVDSLCWCLTTKTPDFLAIARFWSFLPSAEPQMNHCSSLELFCSWESLLLPVLYRNAQPALKRSRPWLFESWSTKTNLTWIGLHFCELRVPEQVAEQLFSQSATTGIYIEPRSTNGRLPCPEHSVVWLPKKGLRDALLAAQTSTVKCNVARNGQRFGLRVPKQHAAAVHKAHRPDIDFIEGGVKQTYRLGPFPWGTTKQALQKVFAAWGWPARVGQPAGQDPDHRGVFWSAVASQSPSHWVFTMTHGDVLITCTDTVKQQSPQVSHGVVASVKTIKAIKQIAEPTKDDPWLQHDPWARPSQAAKPIAKDQLAAMEVSITNKIKAAVLAEDASMPAASDTRVQELEDQVKTLSSNFTQLHASMSGFQQQQQQHNTQVANQISTLKGQVDSQASSLQGMIESKLDDQMTRLEALLSKRLRSHEWPDTPWPLANMYVSCTLTDAQIRCLRLYSLIYRIGEAKNPGPTVADERVCLTIGVANPTGLLTKAKTLASLPGTVPAIWGISESQLSAAGIRKFHKELSATKSAYKLFPSAPAPPRSTSCKAIGGKPVGTAFLTTVPCKPLQPTWNEDTWQKARFNAHTFFCQGQWIHGAVCYGYAHQANTKATRAATDDLLSELTYRIAQALPGKRFIGGDFNQTPGLLEQTRLWEQWGWREVQQLSHSKYGTTPEFTCKHTTTKDFLWISPEFVPFFDHCVLDHNLYKDHAALAAIFRPFGPIEKIPLWRKPRSIDWPTLGHIPSSHFKLDFHSDTDLCQQIAEEFESRTAAKLAKQQSNLQPCQKGRSATTATKQVLTYDRPLPTGRAGDYLPQFHGISLQQSRWIKQLRRLESFSRTNTSHTSIGQQVHRQREWRCIRHASGFPCGFAKWWQAKCKVTPGVLHTIPFDPPDNHHSQLLRLEFEIEVQALEQVLIRDITSKAMQRRVEDPHLIFRDPKARKAPLVELLGDSKQAVIQAVCPDELALELNAQVAWNTSVPICSAAGILQPIHIEPDKIWVHDLPNLQPGAKLHQEVNLGHIHDLFRAFQDEWQLRWDRHLDTPETQWEPILTFMDQHVPPGPGMPYTPISLDEWNLALKRKKRTAAVGPDGWSKADLQALPEDLTRAILDILSAVEQGLSWPQSLMHGLIHSLQKHELATQVAHYRPITLTSMIYRCWSSIRAKQLLQHFAHQADSTICGNMPHKTTKDVWYTIQLQIEHSQHLDEPAAGCVVDLIKAFNTLPRVPLLAACLHFGAPPEIVKAWGSSLCQLERRFVIRGGASSAQKSSTGFAEGCAMSVVAMLAANMLSVQWLRHHQCQATVFSYVDNIELISNSPDTIEHDFSSISAFFHALDLQLDPNKTYFWATAAAQRHALREDGHNVSFWARDLGAHIQYTKQATNSVITSKAEKFLPTWKDLARSYAPMRQKTHALRSVARPNILHGVSSVHLGSHHFDSLRTHALRGLVDQTPGTSPTAFLALCEHPSLDPEFHSIWDTVKDFRVLTNYDAVGPMLECCVQPTTRVRPAPGPCHVLLNRLQSIGWSWDDAGFFRDTWSQPIDLWNACLQDLHGRLVTAYQTKQCALLATRKGFQGMEHTSARFSLEAKPKDPVLLGTLRRCWDGTFFTANHLRHRAEPQDTACAFCSQPDSAFHRHWECPALE